MRAGERTRLIVADKPVPAIRFRATVLDGEPQGRIEVDRNTGDGLPDVVQLSRENTIDGADLAAISVIPAQDTAITFLPQQHPARSPALIGGALLVAGALVWTVFDMMAI